MITKTPSKRGTTTRVSFVVPPEVAGETAHLCGDFNDWSQDATPMTKRKDGRFTVTITLEQGRAYAYRYLIDDDRWENDGSADEYIDNNLGSKNSVVLT